MSEARLQELKHDLYNLYRKAEKVGVFKGSTMTCLTIPSYLYDKIRATWEEIKELEPDYIYIP